MRLFPILKLVTAKKTHASLGNPTAVDEDGFLIDIDVQSVHDSESEGVQTRENKRRDIDTFFSLTFLKTVNGHVKKYCTCKLCPYVSLVRFMFSNESIRIGTKEVLSTRSQLYAVIWRLTTQ